MRTSLCCCAIASLLCVGCGGAGAQPRAAAPDTKVASAAAPAAAAPTAPASPNRHWKFRCHNNGKHCENVLKLTDAGYGTQVVVTDKHGDIGAAWLEQDQNGVVGLHTLDNLPQPRQTNVTFFQLTPSGAILTTDSDGVVRVLYGTEAVVVPTHGSPVVLSDDGMHVVYSDNGVWETDLDPKLRQFSNPRELFANSASLLQFGPDGSVNFVWAEPQQVGNCAIHFNNVVAVPTTPCNGPMFLTLHVGDSSLQLFWVYAWLVVSSSTSTDGGQTWSAPVQLGPTFQHGEVYQLRVADFAAWGKATPGAGFVYTSDGRTFGDTLFGAAYPDVSTFCGNTIVFTSPFEDGPFPAGAPVSPPNSIFMVSGQGAPVATGFQGFKPHIDAWGHLWWESQGDATGPSENHGGAPGELDVVQLSCPAQ